MKGDGIPIICGSLKKIGGHRLIKSKCSFNMFSVSLTRCVFLEMTLNNLENYDFRVYV